MAQPASGTAGEAQAAKPRLTIRPKALTFQRVGEGSSAQRAVTLSNPSVTPITITGVKSSNPQFAANQNCVGQQVSKGSPCTFEVVFTPQKRGPIRGVISVTDSLSARAQRISAHGTGKGGVPGAPTATPTATPDGQATPTPTATPTPSPGSSSAGSAVRTSANAPGVEVSGRTVTVFLPLGSDDESNVNVSKVVLENASGVLPTPSVITTDRVNSCAPDQLTGEVICSGQTGTIDLIAPGASSATTMDSGSTTGVEYTGGDCVDCGAMTDDELGLGIISTGSGYEMVNLATGAVSLPISANGEPVSVDFGYSPKDHLILSANYQVLNPNTFATSPPHFQIIDISGSTPQVFDLSNDASFFGTGGVRTCTGSGGTSDRDILPDSTAIDTATSIAFVTFHTPAACFSNPIADIGLVDLAQASFTAGSPDGSWDSPGKQIQTLSEYGGGGITAITVVPSAHLALIGDQGNSNHFAVAALPTASGSGTPALVDWAASTMPNDPDGNAWLMWHQPNGVTSYISPNTGKAMAVVMNNGNGKGPTFVALVDIAAMLNAQRAAGTSHTVGVNLVSSGIVRFVRAR